MKGREIQNYRLPLLIVGVLGVIFFVRVLAQTPTPEPDRKQIGEPPVSETATAVPNEDYWGAGQNIEIKSEGVKGDVVVAGANIKISGSVEGYMMAAGANVNVDGPIGNDLWVAGSSISVGAPVGDNATMAGSSVVLEPNATIGKDLRIAAGSTEIKSHITRNLNISAANASISSEIGGNVEAYAETLTLAPGAIVRGDLIVYSPNEPIISSQAQVLGRVNYHKTEGGQNSSSAVGNWFGNWFLTFLWITVLGLVAVWFSSVWTNRVAEMLRKEAGKSFLVGLVSMLLVPFVFILLLVTVVGLPLAFVLGAISLVAFLLSGAFVAFLVGDWLLKLLKRWENSNVLKIVFGALVITLIMSLPWIGWLAKLAVMFFGVGAFILERRDLVRQLREHGLA